MNKPSRLPRDHSKMIQISNIPPNATEKELRQIFQMAGLIANFELSQEKDNTKQNGTAICEYKDIESVQESIDFFNGHHMHGAVLRVATLLEAFQKEEEHLLAQRQQSSRVNEKADGPLSSETSIQDILSPMSEQMQAEIVCEFKTLLTKHPAQAKQMLIESPQFAHTILRLMVMYGLISQQDVFRFRQQQQQQAATAAQGGRDHSSAEQTQQSQKQQVIEKLITWFRSLPPEVQGQYQQLFGLHQDDMQQHLQQQQVPSDIAKRLLLLKRIYDQGVRLF